MSSSYLTSENMSMIERVLRRARDFPYSHERNATKARFLVARFQAGITNEADLREALLLYVKAADAQENVFSGWSTQDSTVGGVVAKLHNLIFGKRLLPSKLASIGNILRIRPNDAQFRRLNDTDGRQRRENEIKSRNQMH